MSHENAGDESKRISVSGVRDKPGYYLTHNQIKDGYEIRISNSRGVKYGQRTQGLVRVCKELYEVNRTFALI